MPYFDCQLQTQNGNVRAVCFSPSKVEDNYELFSKHKSPVKIKKFNINEKYGNVNVVIQDTTKVNTLNKPYEFPYESTGQNNVYTIQDSKKIAAGQIVSVKAHVTEMGPVRRGDYQDEPNLGKQGGTY